MASLPFASLNLRWNPFGEPAPEELQALFVGGLEGWPSFLRAETTGEGEGTRRVLQLLGPSGCGKTTALLSLKMLFPGSGSVVWCPVHGWSDVPESHEGPLFVDDAQMASRDLLQALLRSQALAVATQTDLAVFFRKADFRMKTVQVQDRVSLPWLMEVVHRRLRWARRGPGPLPGVEKAVIQELHDRHGPDLVAIQADLYDWYQQLEDEA